MGALWHPFSDMGAVERGGDFVIERGEGAHVWDVDGNHYLDATAYAVAARTIWGLWTIRPKQQALKKRAEPRPAAPARVASSGSGGSWISMR